MDTFVIAGLDPAIHLLRKTPFELMDARIIPDHVGDRRPGMTSV
jgi:hypothetical protein